MKTLQFKTILQRFRDIVRDATAIDNWCLEKYDKPLTIMVGVDPKNPPDTEDCPVFFIFDIQKVEGDGEETFTYMLSAAVSVYDESAPVVTGNVKEYLAAYDVDDLAHMVIQELAAVIDITTVDMGLEAFRYPQFTERMDIMFEIPHTMGGSDTIDF